MSRTRVAMTGAVLFTAIVSANWVVASALSPGGFQSGVTVSWPSAPSRKVITTVKPVYPPEALRLGLEADVELKLTVNAAGDVTKTETVAGGIPKNIYHDDANAAERAEFVAQHPGVFSAAADAAARQWRFEPGNSELTWIVPFGFGLKPEVKKTQVGGQLSGSPMPSSTAGSARPGELASAAPSGPLRVGGNIKPPRKIVDVKPIYPDEARALKAKGVVLLEVTIATDGSVSNARVLRSIPIFDQAAINAVMQWKFEPMWLNGKTVEVQMIVFVNFIAS